MALRITSLTTTAGYLEKTPVQFAPGLTCVIGARGTCKSTIIETIRFAFHCDQKRCDQLSAYPATEQPGEASYSGLIRTTLAGGTARCTLINDKDNSEWTVERDLDSLPRVFHEGVKQVADPPLLHQIEIYSQGDLQRIAQDGNRRLALIDQPNKEKIEKLHKRRSEAGERLRALGPDLRNCKTAMETLRSQLKMLDSFRASLKELQGQRPELSAALETERKAFLHRSSIFERAQTAVAASQALTEQLRELTANESIFRDIGPDLEGIAHPEATTLKNSFQSIATVLASVKDAIDKNPDRGAELALDQLRARFEEDNAPYYALRKEQQDMNEVLKREDALRQQIQQLERLEGELEIRLKEYGQLSTERTQLRQTIDDVGEELYRLRLMQVEQINAAHNDVVLLTLHQGTQSQEYRDAVSQLLQGSRIRNQDEVAGDLADKVRPSDLIDIVESGDSQRLAEILERDMGQMARLVSYLLDQQALYDVESAAFEDWLEITLFVDGVAKPITQLSKGQMATALLPLILRDADYPLLFDQPEDDLDNRFVYGTLVRAIQDLKKRRQLIFVTHNANIPVLGEAEKVVVMSMESPTRAGATFDGDVDTTKQQILGLLEGGPEAFTRRRVKYGQLVA